MVEEQDDCTSGLFPHFQVFISGNQILPGDTVAMGVGEVTSLSLLTRTTNSYFRAFSIRTVEATSNAGALALAEDGIVPRDARTCNETTIGIRNSDRLSPRTLVAMRFRATNAGLVVIRIVVANATIAVTERTCFQGRIQLQLVQRRTLSPTVSPTFPPTLLLRTDRFTFEPSSTLPSSISNASSTWMAPAGSTPAPVPATTDAMVGSSDTRRCWSAISVLVAVAMMLLVG